MLAPNSILNEEYQIVGELGRGGMGVVYLGVGIKLNNKWAIKEIDKSKLKPAEIKEVREEAALLSKISHPSIPRVTSVLDDANSVYLYIIQDYISGSTLNHAIHKRSQKKASEGITDKYKQKQLSLKEVRIIAKQLIDTFIYLHTRTPAILYRDLKPGNIMIDTESRVHLIDFGIAFEMDEPNLVPGVRKGVGTMGYAAPEQFGRTPTHTLQTDIFNFGRVMYELVTGFSPVPTEIGTDGRPIQPVLPPMREIRPDVDEAMEEIIYTCMQRDLNDRYKTFNEVKYAFDNYDKLGPSYKAEATKQINTVKAIGITSILSLIASVGLFTFGMYTEKVKYEDMLAQVDVYNSTEKVADLINQNPSVIKPYNRLSTLYKNDDVFDLDEEQEFLKLISQNLSTLKKQEGFGDMAYQIGLMYIFYYKATDDVEENNKLRFAQSVTWFKYAIDYNSKDKKTAEIYYNIGLFNRDIVLAIKQGEDVGMYKEYFNNLSKLPTLLDDKTPDLVKLEANSTILNAIVDYRENFEKDGIKPEVINNLMDESIKQVNNIEPKSDSNKNKKKEIQTKHKALFEQKGG